MMDENARIYWKPGEPAADPDGRRADPEPLRMTINRSTGPHAEADLTRSIDYE